MADDDEVEVIACSAAVLFCASAYLFKFLSKAAYSMVKALPSEEIIVRCVQHGATRRSHSD